MNLELSLVRRMRQTARLALDVLVKPQPMDFETQCTLVEDLAFLHTVLDIKITEHTENERGGEPIPVVQLHPSTEPIAEE